MSESEPQEYAPDGVQPLPFNPTGRPANGAGTAALIVGIIAIVGSFIPLLNYLTGFAGVAALILGIVGLTRTGRPKRAALAGTILGGAGLVLSIILAVVYTIGFASFGAKSASPQAPPPAATTSAAPAPSASAAPAKRSPNLGDSATNNRGVAWTVSSVQCGLTSAPSAYGGDDVVPTGNFCAVNFGVTNGSTNQILVDDDSIHPYAGAVKYSANDEAGHVGSGSMLLELNPGLTSTGTLYFDVAPGTVLDRVTLETDNFDLSNAVTIYIN